MPKSTRKFAPGKLDSQQVANSWLELGILPVPLEPASKKPAMKKGWNTLRVTKETIPQFFSNGQNVGGLWGEPSGWLVDIDLDCPEAVAIAPLILPETFVYGRRSIPCSHYVYRCEGVSTTKFFEKDEGMLLEIRSTGSQSVLPPSIHPDKERYEINHDVPFKSVSRRELESLCQAIGAASLLARHYPKGGGRHDYIHAITGTLMWGGWPEPKTRSFLDAILGAVDDKEDDRRQRERTINNTIEHFHKGDKIAGWKTLSQWLPGHIVSLVRTWLSMKPQETVPETVAQDEEYKLDRHLLDVPGLVGEIAKWSSSRSYLQQPIFDLAVGLMCTALATTNKYVVDGKDTPLQPYFMLVAPTAGGKESALDNVYTFSRRINLHEYVFQGFQSYHSLLDRMSAAPNMACWLWDEAARKLKSVRNGNSPDHAVMTWLLSLYGKANSFSPGVPGRHHAIPPIDHPFLTVFATAQPQQLMEAITDSDLSTGLVNRFVLFDVGDVPPPDNLRRQLVFPTKLEEAIQKIRVIEPPAGDYPFIRIRMEDATVWAQFQDFSTEARVNAYKGGGGEMWGRANQNALILAGLVAVGIEARRPMITAKIAAWAISFVRWSSQRWTSRVDSSSSRTVVELRSKTVERMIRQAQLYQHRTTQPKLIKLLERGVMPRSLLIRMCRHISSRDLDDVITQLISGNLIANGNVDGNDVYWVKK